MVRPKLEASSSPDECSEWKEMQSMVWPPLESAAPALHEAADLDALTSLGQFSWIQQISTCSEGVWTKKTCIPTPLWGIFFLSVCMSAWGGSPCSSRPDAAVSRSTVLSCRVLECLPAAKVTPCTAITNFCSMVASGLFRHQQKIGLKFSSRISPKLKYLCVHQTVGLPYSQLCYRQHVPAVRDSAQQPEGKHLIPFETQVRT